MTDLRSKLIRLAHQQPSLRPHLLPLLKTAALDPRAIAKEPKVIDKLEKIQSAVAPIPAIANQWSGALRQPNLDAAALKRLNLDEYSTSGNAYAFSGIQEQMAEMVIEIATIETRAKTILRTIHDLLKP
jgi:hypothetical protein